MAEGSAPTFSKAVDTQTALSDAPNGSVAISPSRRRLAEIAERIDRATESVEHARKPVGRFQALAEGEAVVRYLQLQAFLLSRSPDRPVLPPSRRARQSLLYGS